MSIESIKIAIREFLSSSKPEVLCIRGHWGTGKTHNWKAIAREQREISNAVALNEYAYVSLFGVNSIGELKIQILQNTVVRSQIGDLTSFSTINNAVGTLERGSKKTIMQSLRALFKDRAEAIVSAIGLLTNKQIICIDDLERKGSKLSSSEILGFISYLKEERECKIALLLNDEALDGEDKRQFAAYLEKVVDRNIRFVPTPAESAEIAISDKDETAQLIQERCVQLGIDNIRVIRKIHLAVREIEPLLSTYKPDVFKSVAASIVLFGWMNHQPEIAPDIEFLRRHSRLSVSDAGKELSPKEMKWAARLDGYGFTGVDDFDFTLIDGISDGYFTQERIDTHAKELHNRVLQREAMSRFRDAWGRLHYSFRSGEEVVIGIAQAFKNEVAFMSVDNLHGVVKLLRSFEMNGEVGAIIDAYVEANAGVKDAFDVSRIFLRDEDLDDEVEERLDAARLKAKKPRHIDQIFLQLNDDAFSAETLTILSSAPVGEYIRIFNTYEGEDLRMILTGIFQYDRVGNATDTMKAIVNKGREALTAIAKGSRINAHRARGWGVVLPTGNKVTTADDGPPQTPVI